MAQAVDRRRKQTSPQPSAPSTSQVVAGYTGQSVAVKQVTAITPAYESIKVGYDSSMETLAFTPDATKELVKHYYWMLYRGSPVPSLLLIGPPGVGKSTAVREVAEEIAKQVGKVFVDITNKQTRDSIYREIMECAKTKDLSACLSERNYFLFMDLRLTEVEPVDLVGYPYREEGRMEYSPPAWALLFSWFPGILFLDELSNVRREDVMAAAYKLLLDKAAGFTKFHRNVLVVAAGNLPTHAPGIAQQLPPPVVNRVAVKYVSAPTIDEWYKWMNSQINELVRIGGLDAETGAQIRETLDLVTMFLINNPEDFINTKQAGGMRSDNFPTPRSWSHFVFSYPMSTLRRIAENKESLVAVISAFVGPVVASKLADAITGYVLIPFREVLNDPSKFRAYVDEVVERAKLKNQGKVISALTEITLGLAIGLPIKIIEFKPSRENVSKLLDTAVKTLREHFAKNAGRDMGDFTCSMLRSISAGLKQLVASKKVIHGEAELQHAISVQGAVDAKVMEEKCTQNVLNIFSLLSSLK
ncbi:MAG: ATP-binding protein [Thermofilaceae archaeon]